MIRLFTNDNKLREILVKQFLKHLIIREKLNISFFHSNDKPKNTQLLGKEVIISLKEIKLEVIGISSHESNIKSL